MCYYYISNIITTKLVNIIYQIYTYLFIIYNLMTIHCKFNPFIHMTSLNNYMSMDYCQRDANIVARW